jgi:drug/metabolite transporter (DMT)-like permease
MKHSNRRSEPSSRGLAPGIWAGLASALLFGAGTPLAKGLLDDVSPWLLAGLLYVGSGVGLGLYRLVRRLPTPRLRRSERGWLMAAVLCGGCLAPVLLMWGLATLPASHVALLLNAEAVLTTVLAWAVFKEHLGPRIVLGMAAIVAGAVVLAWPPSGSVAVSAFDLAPAAAVVAACLLWALDNNFTRKVSLADASWVACVKGSAAGVTNLVLALALGAALPPWPLTAAAMGVGLLAYGVSLALFVMSLRHLGASRAGAYFSVAPFVGAVMSVVWLAEPVTWPLLAAGALMLCGVWLHLSETHSHTHRHLVQTHTHAHSHDDKDPHHDHSHADGLGTSGKPHTHVHEHTPLTHTHEHFPDAHHRHTH